MGVSRLRLPRAARFASVAAFLLVAIYVFLHYGVPAESPRTGTPRDYVTPDKRGDWVRQICESTAIAKSKGKDSRRRLLIFEPLNVTLCYAPKAGCTFWKRVFLSLQTIKPGVVSLPRDVFGLQKQRSHYTKIGNLADISTFDESYGYLSKSRRFMFVRDPYARLFSAYIDKFYLGDFWRHGKKIIKKLRGSNPALTCGHDVTFTEFLRMATDEKLSDMLGGSREHWVSVAKLCSPCQYNYQYIGKTETFDDDRKFIMRTLGMDSYVKTSISRDDTAVDAIVQVVQMYWSKNLHDCMPKSDYIARLYESFKIQGYLPLDSTLNLRENTTESEFIDEVVERYKRRRQTLAEWNTQRREVLVQAYNYVPMSVKRAIAETYDEDFRLFGYDREPSDIFYK